VPTYLANLYVAEHEQYMLSATDVLYYGRYIEDIFAIIIADSSESAIRKFRHVLPAPGLNLQWNVTNTIWCFNLKIFRNRYEDSHFEFKAFPLQLRDSPLEGGIRL
jgi:hypothetical protein